LVAEVPAWGKVPPVMRPHRTPFGLLLALLALGCQLAVGATVPAAAAQALAPLAGYSVICHADDGTGGAPTPQHKAPDCQLCPLCAAFSTPAAALVDRPFVPPPVAIAILVAAPRPPSTAPPSAHRLDARPRGPPSRV
jgi:hypothetical protein